MGNPYDDESPCEMCGNFVAGCTCPECVVCGMVGDPHCYPDHGMAYTAEQLRETERRKLPECPMCGDRGNSDCYRDGYILVKLDSPCDPYIPIEPDLFAPESDPDWEIPF